MSGNGDLGLTGGVVSSSGTQEPALAKAAAPPTPMTVDWESAAAVGCVAGFIIAAIVGAVVHTESAAAFQFLGGAAVAILVGRAIYTLHYRTAKEYNDRVYRPEMAVWDRSIMCMRCGAITELVAPTGAKSLLD